MLDLLLFKLLHVRIYFVINVYQTIGLNLDLVVSLVLQIILDSRIWSYYSHKSGICLVNNQYFYLVIDFSNLENLSNCIGKSLSNKFFKTKTH